MLRVAVALVLLQLGFRAWAVYDAWYQFDDFAWMSMSLNQDLDWSFLTTPYAGHLMPGGFLLSWLYFRWDPLDFTAAATTLLVLQAVASLGFVRLLVHLFGRRPGIVPAVALYLFSVITVPAYIWWAAGINQLPLQIALFFGLHAHVSYLRTRSFRYVLQTLAWTVFGLLFYEKSLLVFAVYGLVAICYFTSGPTLERFSTLWSRYRAGLVAHGVVALGYLGVYLATSLNFSPNNANEHPLFPVAYRLVLVAFASGVVGGPLRWIDILPVGRLADPTEIVMVLSWAAVGGFVYLAAKTRNRSKRAWSLVLVVLAADVLLLAAGRAFLVGPNIGLEYRYQTEAAALTALSMCLALLPLRGAVETVERREGTPAAGFEEPRLLALLTVGFVALSTVSTLQYVTDWQQRNPAPAYFARVKESLHAERGRVPLVNLAVPDTLMWGFRYPENTYRQVFRMYDGETSYPQQSTDRLFAFDDSGRLRPAAVPPVRRERPSRTPGCGYRLGPAARTVPLNGPVFGGGWWVRVGYTATRDTTTTVTVGQRTLEVALLEGVHALYLDGEGQYDGLDFGALTGGAAVCVNEVTIGIPTAAPAS